MTCASIPSGPCPAAGTSPSKDETARARVPPSARRAAVLPAAADCPSSRKRPCPRACLHTSSAACLQLLQYAGRFREIWRAGDPPTSAPECSSSPYGHRRRRNCNCIAPISLRLDESLLHRRANFSNSAETERPQRRTIMNLEDDRAGTGAESARPGRSAGDLPAAFSYGPAADSGSSQAAAHLWTADGSYEVGDLAPLRGHAEFRTCMRRRDIKR